MGRGWQEQHGVHRDAPAVVFVDLGTVRDPSVIALGFEQDGIAHCPADLSTVIFYRSQLFCGAGCFLQKVFCDVCSRGGVGSYR
jgi:hypothetical protein